jgi:FKBP-type peptidyl-prolyl cis-trans isomerase
MIPILLALAAGLGAAPAPPAAKTPAPIIATASGLRLQTIVPGTGSQPQLADSVLVTYEGRLSDGTIFDASPNPVPLPVSELVPGFTEALLLMKKGGRYRIWIPADLAYGEQGAGGVIPPNAELEFTVSLIDIAAATTTLPQ